MDFLCPSCQKMLTVPDQYAGTLMKCPLCQNTFQAPALPAQAPALAPAGPVTPPPPPPGDVYGLKEPPPPPPLPPLTGTGSDAPALKKSVSATPPPAPLATGHQVERAIPLSPRVLPYVAPVCLGLVFVLTFFPWVGYYWGGRGMLTQGAWGALTGYSATPDLTEWQTVSGLNLKETPAGANLLLLPWLFLFLLALVVSIASAVLPHATQVKLPPAVEPHKHYRWALTGVLTLLSLLVLLLIMVLGFSMEHNAWTAAQNKVATMKSENPGSIHSDDEAALFVGREYAALGVRRTLWFRLVLLLELIAVAAAGLTFWLDSRGPKQPVPQLVLRW